MRLPAAGLRTQRPARISLLDAPRLRGLATSWGLGSWPAANRAILVPVEVPYACRVTAVGWVNGTLTNAIDVGLYDQDGVRLLSSGSQARSGANAPQTADITDVNLVPGVYYLAGALDGTSGTLFRANLGSVAWRIEALGAARVDSAFPLPTSVTLATPTDLLVPWLWLEVVP